MKAFATSLLVLAIAAPSALADGLPLPVDGADDASVGSLDGSSRYGAVSNGGATTVLRIDADGGRITRSRTLGGELSVPLVAYDGTASGLSADGTTLALIQPRRAFPRETTKFTILDTTSLRTTSTVHLDGDFSFDAISPRGDRLYLVHYQSRRDPTDYEVRVYDVDRGKLLPNPIVDPDEPDEQMAGFPQARVMSPDGRWAYTLYSGGEETFIHALDTKGFTAQCIDIEGISPRDMYMLGLEVDPGSGELTVLDHRTPAALVDPRTFEVSDPIVPVPDSTAEADAGEPTWVGWAALGGGLALIGALVMLLWRRRKPADGVSEPALERLVRIDADERTRTETPREPVR